jgi:hypothetical protein
MRKSTRKIAEGFGPVYKDGKIAPGFEGLGPKYITPSTPAPRTPKIQKKAPQRSPFMRPRSPGKRYYA